MQIPIGGGGIFYRLRLVNGYVFHPIAGKCLGLCDTDRCVIQISDVPPPAKRLKTFAHELAHAIRAECDPTRSALIDEETHCELASMGTLLPAKTIACVEIYLTTGIKVEDVIMIPGVKGAIPVVM